MLKILAIGDVCGPCGLDILRRKMNQMKQDTGADLIVVNGENAGGRGLVPAMADEIFFAGADVITLGNHTFDQKSIYDYLDEKKNIIRPANLPAARPGYGYTFVDVKGKKVGILNMMGRHLMDYMNTDPFEYAENLLKREQADIWCLDFHTETTSEKQCMGYFLDGRFSCIWGTHTHVQTADNHVLPKGTGYISDLGMTGSLESCIGMEYEQAVRRFRGQLVGALVPSDKDPGVQGALFTLEDDGKCVSVERFTWR